MAIIIIIILIIVSFMNLQDQMNSMPNREQKSLVLNTT